MSLSSLPGRCLAALTLLFLSACGPSKAELAEQHRIECLDKLCEGDILPKYDVRNEEPVKLNGLWFISPRKYGDSALAFFWPSKTPARSADRSKTAPEFVSIGPDGTSNFYDVGIEIFLRSSHSHIPPEPRGYKFIALAQAQDWIAQRTTLRPGLERLTMKHVIGPTGYRIDHVTYYVATDLTGLDGLPPVAVCNHDHPQNGGGTGFMWQSGIWAGVRMNQRHCVDWPEIYREVMHVLQQVKKA